MSIHQRLNLTSWLIVLGAAASATGCTLATDENAEALETQDEATGRNVRATSKHFGRDRRQIYRWLELFGIER